MIKIDFISDTHFKGEAYYKFDPFYNIVYFHKMQRDIKNAIAGIVKSYGLALSNDGQIVGSERLKIIETVEGAIHECIMFVIKLIYTNHTSFSLTDEKPYVFTLRRAGVVKHVTLNIYSHRYSFSGRCLSNDLNTNERFRDVMQTGLRQMEALFSVSSDAIADKLLTPQELEALGTVLLEIVYQLMILKYKLESLQINT